MNAPQLADELSPFWKYRDGKRRPAQKEHGHVEQLDQDLAALHGVGYGGQNQANGSKRQDPD